MHIIKGFLLYLFTTKCVVTPRGMCDVPNNHYSVLRSGDALTCPRDMHISPSLHNIITLITLLGAYLGHVIRGFVQRGVNLNKKMIMLATKIVKNDTFHQYFARL